MSKKYLEFYFRDSFKEIKGYVDCNPNDKGSYGSKKDKPDFLSQCFFRKQVLDKYIREGKTLYMPHDSGNEDYVMVYLGDLGTHLSTEEQYYWKSYNITEDIEKYSISKAAFQADYLAEFPNPHTHIQIFKDYYERVNDIWNRKIGFNLWLPAKPDDEYKRDKFDLPMYNTQDSFDEQCMKLGFLIGDLLNSTDIKKYLDANQIPYQSGTKGITHFQLIIQNLGYSEEDNLIKRMRSVRDLRHCVHQKGSDYERGLSYFAIIGSDYIQSFKNILAETSSQLEALEERLYTLD